MEKQSLFIVGEARTNVENAITKIYGSFYMVFEIDPLTDKIIDMNCTHSLDLTELYSKNFYWKIYYRRLTCSRKRTKQTILWFLRKSHIGLDERCQ